MIFKEKIKLVQNIIFSAFPTFLHDDVDIVISTIEKTLFLDKEALTYNSFQADNKSTFIVSDNEKVQVPYRLLIDEVPEIKSLSLVQKMILNCIYSRSTNGYVREKHIQAILQEDLPNWAMPFILKISDEYVVEILELTYSSLKEKDNSKIQEFCQINKSYLKYAYARMISYWNCYYRKEYKNLNKYIGKKLFDECFGYSKKR
jgi:hypothetical protein